MPDVNEIWAELSPRERFYVIYVAFQHIQDFPPDLKVTICERIRSRESVVGRNPPEEPA